jgi:hypothetical protein
MIEISFHRNAVFLGSEQKFGVFSKRDNLFPYFKMLLVFFINIDFSKNLLRQINFIPIDNIKITFSFNNDSFFTQKIIFDFLFKNCR